MFKTKIRSVVATVLDFLETRLAMAKNIDFYVAAFHSADYIVACSVFYLFYFYLTRQVS